MKQEHISGTEWIHRETLGIGRGKEDEARTIVGGKQIVELLKISHTTQLAQQTGTAINIQYLTIDASKANKQFKLLNTKITKQSRLERIAHRLH